MGDDTTSVNSRFTQARRSISLKPRRQKHDWSAISRPAGGGVNSSPVRRTDTVVQQEDISHDAGPPYKPRPMPYDQ